MYVNNWKFSKIFKHAKLKFIKNPRYFLKSNQNIKLHFDVFHGEGFMNKAIELDDKEKDDFKNFVNFQHGFHRENLFFVNQRYLWIGIFCPYSIGLKM